MSWVHASGGAVPDGAVPHGHERTGEPLFVCRVTLPDGSIHPGKVRPGLGAACIPLGGKEIKFAQYEVLMGAGTWAYPPTGRKLPEHSVVCGHEGPSEHNENLFVIRASWNGGVHPGKMSGAYREGHIPYGGKELEVAVYEVLIGL